MDLYVEAQRWEGTAREQLDTLCLVEMPRARKERLEAILVLRQSTGVAAVRELEERGGA